MRIAAILLLSLALRLYYLLAAPIGIGFENGIQGSDDEMSHMNYVLALTHGNSIPVQTDSPRTPGAFERNAFEYHQPPLFYWLGARVVEASGAQLLGLQVRWVRLLCVAFAMMQVALCWPVLARAFSRRADAEAAFLIVALLGAHVKATTFVANDALIFLLFTAALVLTIRREERASPIEDAALAATLAAAWYTKASTTVLCAFVAAAGALSALARRDVSRLLWPLALVAISAVLASPWYLRNIRVYGDPLAFSTSQGPRFAYPMNADSLVPRLLHLPYEMFFGWYVERPGALFSALTKIEYIYLGIALVLLARLLVRRNAAEGAPVAANAGRLALLLFLLNCAGHAVFAFTYGFFGPRQILGSVAAWALILAIPASGAATRWPPISPLWIAALLVVPQHILVIASALAK